MSLSSYIPNHLPRFLTDLYRAGSQAYKTGAYEGELTNRKNVIFIEHGLRTAIVATICFAAYQGSMIAVTALSTLSLPATTVALGVMCLAKGGTALKAVFVAKQFLQVPVALAALYTGWLALDRFYIVPFKNAGLFEFSQGFKASALQEVSNFIASQLGY